MGRTNPNPEIGALRMPEITYGNFEMESTNGFSILHAAAAIDGSIIMFEKNPQRITVLHEAAHLLAGIDDGHTVPWIVEFTLLMRLNCPNFKYKSIEDIVPEAGGLKFKVNEYYNGLKKRLRTQLTYVQSL